MRAVALSLCALCAVVLPLPAAEQGHVTATVVSDAARLEPGAGVRVGVRLEMDPGWHVYWTNPGDAGLATDVALELPAGWRAGEVAWPTPIRFEQPGGIEGFGYEDEVVLVRELQLPERIPTRVKVPVAVSWLACREVCVLGQAELELELPVPAAAAAEAARLLDRWSAAVPDCGDGRPFTVTTRPGGGEGALTAWLRWRAPVEDVGWFPEALESVRVESARTTTRGGLTRIDLTVRAAAGAELPPVLPSVVAWRAGDGLLRGGCLDLDLRMQ